MKKKEAYIYRKKIEVAAAGISDENALNSIELFPLWKSGIAVEVNARFAYEECLYKCLQSHTTQADWTPPATPVLWLKVVAPGEIPEWCSRLGRTMPIILATVCVLKGIFTRAL